jgi:MerR family copper efflux transcriptional regulator
LKKLVFIRRARRFGFTIADCRELLDLYQNQERSSSDVKSIARKRLLEIEEKQRELQALHETLNQLVLSCKGDPRPHCPIIDFLR